MNFTGKNRIFLSKKQIPIRERLILALDVPSVKKAKELVIELGDSVHFYKIGLELFMSEGYFELAKWLGKRKKKVFLDLKLFDISQTIASAVRQLKKYKAEFVTVHGNDEILKAAVSQKSGIKILAVTVLTSLDEKDMKDLGFKCDVRSLVLSRARRALKLGCDGVISSGLEASLLRSEIGDKLLIITPGIRPVKNREESNWQNQDDQKRITTVEEAFSNGADYIVVGRPIREAKNPKATAEAIQKTIAQIFSNS